MNNLDSVLSDLMATVARDMVRNGEHRNMNNPIEVRSYLVGCAIAEQVVYITNKCTEENYDLMLQLLDVLEEKVASEKGER